ncbi:MAG: SIS domain-containing protein [Ornithinimicrobium sp.]|uniref:SIS domain-containing protein n=1 Tax=Ornithinimicrobium sp. TaxID=1977084 RepID=UPI0026E0A9FC|nr:SIS domain-containing protein [Ornithinimicrobium sp.]MDO5738782.1 SIS domain-containing protein [Ornithinimicrobium sp.]
MAAQPVKPIDPEDLERAQATVALREELDAYVKSLVEGGLRNVYFVGAGGSLICSYPGHYVLTQRGDTPAFQAQSDEFNTAPPAAMGPGSLVVLASYTGTTKETVAAAKTAKDAGATVVTAAKAGTPLAEASTRNFVAKSDFFELMLAYAVLKATGKVDNDDAIASSLAALPQAIRSAAEQSEDHLAQIAEKFKDDEITYVLGSGPNEAWAYGLAMCYLQEMQWKHAAGFNAGEFFQGAFEVVDDESAVILLMAEDNSRPLAERAKTFLDTYGKRSECIDTAGLELDGVDPELRADLTPLVIAGLCSRLAQHYEAARGHDLKQRKYMFKVEY